MRTVAAYHLKGGVGKTAAAVNIAWNAAQDGVPTLFWDLDPQAAGTWYLRTQAPDTLRAKKLLSGKQGAGRLVQPTAFDNLHVMPAHLSLRAMDTLLARSKTGPDSLKRLIAPFGEQYSLVILDCPPGLSTLAENIFQAAHALAVPVVPSHLSLRALDMVRAAYKGDDHKLKRVMPFYSMVDRRRTLHRAMLDHPPKSMKHRLAAQIPYASAVEKMGEFRAPVGAFAPRHPAAAAYQALWQELRARIGRV